MTTPTTLTPPSGWRPSLDAYCPDLIAARDACAKFVADMEAGEEPYWLTLCGVNGTGKSMMMRQVFEQAKRINPGNYANNPIWPPNWKESGKEGVNIYNDRRPYCIALDEASLARRMRGGEYDLPVDLRGDFFVTLDELGVERDPTNFIANSLSKLCENRIGKWTMFATNLSLKEITERIDARVASRLIRDGNRFININARDYAMRPKPQPVK